MDEEARELRAIYDAVLQLVVRHGDDTTRLPPPPPADAPLLSLIASTQALLDMIDRADARHVRAVQVSKADMATVSIAQMQEIVDADCGNTAPLRALQHQLQRLVDMRGGADPADVGVYELLVQCRADAERCAEESRRAYIELAMKADADAEATTARKPAGADAGDELLRLVQENTVTADLLDVKTRQHAQLVEIAAERERDVADLERERDEGMRESAATLSALQDTLASVSDRLAARDEEAEAQAGRVKELEAAASGAEQQAERHRTSMEAATAALRQETARAEELEEAIGQMKAAASGAERQAEWHRTNMEAANAAIKQETDRAEELDGIIRQMKEDAIKTMAEVLERDSEQESALAAMRAELAAMHNGAHVADEMATQLRDKLAVAEAQLRARPVAPAPAPAPAPVETPAPATTPRDAAVVYPTTMAGAVDHLVDMDGYTRARNERNVPNNVPIDVGLFRKLAARAARDAIDAEERTAMTEGLAAVVANEERANKRAVALWITRVSENAAFSQSDAERGLVTLVIGTVPAVGDGVMLMRLDGDSVAGLLAAHAEGGTDYTQWTTMGTFGTEKDACAAPAQAECARLPNMHIVSITLDSFVPTAALPPRRTDPETIAARSVLRRVQPMMPWMRQAFKSIYGDSPTTTRIPALPRGILSEHSMAVNQRVNSAITRRLIGEF